MNKRLSQEEKRRQVNHVGFHLRDVLLIPNLLSISRLFLAVPAIILIVLNNGPESDKLAVFLLFMSFVTDVLDGWWARTFHVISDLGKILDPVIDKFVVISVTLALGLTDRDPRLPLMIVIYAPFRDSMILFLARRVLKEDHHLFVSAWSGKAATFFMAITLIAYLIPQYLPERIYIVLPWIAMAFLLMSSVDYLEKYWSVKHKLAKKSKRNRQ